MGSDSGEIIFLVLLSGDEYGSDDFVQARVTEKRIRGSGLWSIGTQAVADVTTQALLCAYVALLDESAVDAAIAAGGAALGQYDPSLDEAFSGNDILWTHSDAVFTTEGANAAQIVDHRFSWVEFDIPVNRRLEGDEAIMLVYKLEGSFGANTGSFTGIHRILFQE